MKSLSEIETISKRASRSVGFSWGISEEVGRNMKLLELFSLKGIKHLNEYFKQRSNEKFENLNLISENNKSSKLPYCPIILGVSFLDQIKTLEKFNKIKFYNIAFPLLFLPFLSRSSEIIGKKINFKFDDKEFVLNHNVNILSNLPMDDCPITAQNSEIIFIANEDNFTNQEWKNLYKLSENTFVDETDSLKKGAAGAGLTDND